jgi:uncharacterized NAD(P)/FAD-binding protein YdhS
VTNPCCDARRRDSDSLGHHATCYFVNAKLKETTYTRKSEKLVQNCTLFKARNMSSSIAICGGGACGLAVLLSILELTENDTPIRTIYLFEKRSQIGPGLAYSEGSGNTIINMRADTMGLCISDPLHFTRWLESNKPRAEQGSYPPRQLYGTYLNWLFQSAFHNARSKNVHLQVVYQEVVTVLKKDRTFEIVDESGGTYTVDKVVLALGNFPCCSQPHLANTPGYFETPWPLEKLNTIPKNSSVCIVGSGLSGIDAAIHMADTGHEGLLMLVSRGGRLPKVQTNRLLKPYKGQYALHVIARHLEEYRAEAASPEWLFSKFRSLAEELDLKDWTNFLFKEDPLLQLSRDIQDAERGTLQWRALGDAAAPFFERFWDALAIDDRKAFLEKWNSMWYSYVHAMPYENAVRLQSLMEQGRIVVCDVVEIQHNSSGYTITTRDQPLSSDYLIEASGLEIHVSKIQSRIVESLVSRKLLTPHPLGGFSVDRNTLESTTTAGLYVIGSLTTGVHFYTNGIDRNVIHASRVARHLAKLPLHVHKHIALILPENDKICGSFNSAIIPALLDECLVPFIYIVKDWTPSMGCGMDHECSSSLQQSCDQPGNIHGSHDHAETRELKQDLARICDTLGLSISICSVFDEVFPDILHEHHIDFGLTPANQQWCERFFGTRFEYRWITTDPSCCFAKRAEPRFPSATSVRAEEIAISVISRYIYSIET